MNDRLGKIMDSNLSEDKIDDILGNAIRAKFDAELRLDLEKSLRQDYNLTRGSQRIELKEKRGNRRLFFLAAIAASLALFILAWIVIQPSPGNAQELASAYLTTSEIYHGGALKGNAGNEEARTQAIRSFNAGEYAQAEQYFSGIGNKTEEDLFYSGMSSLYLKEYKGAIAKLESLAGSESRFQEEANWYLAIAYILDGDLATARELLSKMEPSGWNHDKARKLLEALE
ncbi:MAG: hypothetical protein J5I98_18485 [Phaeodactylibacter sp.]|nr:hypothetical protein [Phaeodactylibacter sp.]